MRVVLLALAASAALLAACDRDPVAVPVQPAASPGSSPGHPSPAGSGASAPASTAQPAKEVQGQVDPKSPPQREDFKQRGDAQGPKSAETAPAKER